MAGLAAAAAQASMVSTIPVVVTGGILMKFTEAMMPTREAYQGKRTTRRSRRKRSPYSAEYSGNFSNVGF